MPARPCGSTGNHRRTCARCQPDCDLNANSHRRAGANASARHGPAPSVTSRRKAGATVPVGDNERRRRLATEQVASMKHRIHAGRVRLLEQEAGNPPGAGARRHRSDRDPPCARRHLHAGGGFRRSAALPARRHARLRAVRPRDQGRSFTALWSETSRKAIDDLLAIVTDEATGAVAGLTGAHRRRRRDRSRTAAAAARPYRARPHPRARRAGADAPALLARRQAGRRAHARHPAPYRPGRRQPPARRVWCRPRPAAGSGTASGLQRRPRDAVRRADRLTPR